MSEMLNRAETSVVHSLLPGILSIRGSCLLRASVVMRVAVNSKKIFIA